jgi:hypothetical protein
MGRLDELQRVRGSLANWLISCCDQLVDGLGDEHRRRLTDILQHIDRDYPNGCRCGARGRPW